MDMVKGLDRPLSLTIEQWAGILRCVKKHHSDTKAVIDLERELRIQLDHAVNHYKDHLCFEIFDADDDDLEDTQEIEVPRHLDLDLLEAGVALGEEEELQPMKFAALDLGLVGGLCALLVSAVWTVLVL